MRRTIPIYIVLLLTASMAFGQDSTRAGGLRGWTDRNAGWLVPTFAIGGLVTQGGLHGAFYDGSDGTYTGIYRHLQVHEWAYAHTLTIYGLAYVAGASPRKLTGVMLVGDAVFQGLINVGAGRPFFYADEPGCWTLGPICYPKLASGRARIGQLALGTVILVGPYVIRRLRRRD